MIHPRADFVGMRRQQFLLGFMFLPVPYSFAIFSVL
jgi:hypothetical protein